MHLISQALDIVSKPSLNYRIWVGTLPKNAQSLLGIITGRSTVILDEKNQKVIFVRRSKYGELKVDGVRYSSLGSVNFLKPVLSRYDGVSNTSRASIIEFIKSACFKTAQGQ